MKVNKLLSTIGMMLSLASLFAADSAPVAPVDAARTAPMVDTLIPQDITPHAGPDLQPYAHSPAGWSEPIVASNVPGGFANTPITDLDTIYLDWAVANFGDTAAGPFTALILIDGAPLIAGTSDGLSSLTYTWWQDWAFGPLAAGTYTLQLIADADAEVVESDETNNTYVRTLVVEEGIPQPDLQPSALPGWDDAIIVSNVPGGTVDTTLDENDTLYIDWTVYNGGTANAGPYSTQILLDGVEVLTGPSTGLEIEVYESWLDRTIGPLSPGEYLLTLEVDHLGEVTESEEANNTYSRTIFVEGPPEIRIEPTDVTVDLTEAVPVSQPVFAGGDDPVLRGSLSGWTMDDAYIQLMETAPLPVDAKIRDAEVVMADLADGTAEVIVTLRPAIRRMATMDWSSETARAELRSVNVSAQEAVLASVDGAYEIEHTYDNFGGFSGRFDQASLDALAANPNVYAIEPVRYYTKHDVQGHPQMGASTYFDTYNGSGVTIAICDDGVDYNHPDLGGAPFPNSKVIGGYDFADNDADPNSFQNAHGTACAGIAAGDPPASPQGDYIGGIAKNAKIVALKVFSDGSGGASTADIVASWNWCITNQYLDPANPIKVISNSLGGGKFFDAASADAASPSTLAAVNSAISAGITVLASSGNNGFCDSLAAPAAVSNVISVGALYDADIGAPGWCVDSSSCGPIQANGGCSTGWAVFEVSTAQDQVTLYSNTADFLDIFAPSNNAYTTDLTNSSGYSTSPDNYTANFGGTSAACPYAAGGVAALQSAAMARTGVFLTPAEVLAKLTSTGDPITDGKVAITKPKVNLAAAIDTIPMENLGTFTIYNDGFSDLLVSSVLPESAAPWLSLLPAPPYTIPTGSLQTVSVLVDDTLAPAGTSLTRLLVASNDADENPYPGAVNVTVINSGGVVTPVPIVTTFLDDGNLIQVSWGTDPNYDPNLVYSVWRSTNGGTNPEDFSLVSGPIQGMLSSGFLRPADGETHIYRVEVTNSN